MNDVTLRRLRSRVLPFLFAVLLVLWTGSEGLADVDFLRGDLNADGHVTISDVSMFVCFLFHGCDIPCFDAADVDDDGSFPTITDEVLLFAHLFYQSSRFRGMIASPYPDIGRDATPDQLSCTAYEVLPPEETADAIRLGDVTAKPGTTVSIPVFLTNAVGVDGFQLVIAYVVESISPVPIDPSQDTEVEDFYRGTALEDLYQSPRARGGLAVSLRDFPQEGVFRLGYLAHTADRRVVMKNGDLGPELIIEPGKDVHVANIGVKVSPKAVPGSVIELRLVDQEAPDGVFRNELSRHGAARVVSRVVAGSLTVLRAFVRGDCNDDGGVDLSDAVCTLDWLFRGRQEPGCVATTNANGDTGVDLSDPIWLVQFLFLGGPPPAEPFPDCGPGTLAADETLGCEETACP